MHDDDGLHEGARLMLPPCPPGHLPMPVEVWLAWEQFLREYTLEPGKNVYPEIFAMDWLFPLQRMKETEKMIALARTINPRVIMEIGTDKGGSFFHWVHGLPTVEVAIGIEIRGVPFAEAFKRHFPEIWFLFIEDSSHEWNTRQQVWNFVEEKECEIDCLFIDADKAAFGRDVAEYAPLVRSGGLIFLHDVQIEPNAQETMRRMAEAGYRTETIIDTSEYDEIEKREAAGIPPANSYEGWFRYWKRTSCGVGVIYV